MVALGHYYNEQGQSAFRVFAPEHQSLALLLEAEQQTLPMTRQPDGYWTLSHERLAAGTLYRFVVDGTAYPDPASRCQPLGVHGPSMVTEIQPVHTQGWQGVAIDDAILYELHVGTFTPEGTLAAAVHKLPHLQALGITVIELMPLAAFPGNRNWGYDGTYHFALQHSYGNYAELQLFIEAAHQLGMAVILDVVYNHFGPEGNYAGAFAPYTKQADTPWGAAINFDGQHSAGIRDFYLANTHYWLQEVGFDGFRMDAVSLVFDGSPQNILREITDLGREIGRSEGREILMIAEHLCNETSVTSEQGYHYHSQWNDDLNHALFAYLTPERTRHYASFGDFAAIVKALTEGFVLDGSRFDRHSNRNKGTNSLHTHPTEHVVHIQNHDQIGNRPQGDRLIASYGRDKALLAITAVMASPYVPMLFMGEEYGETAPFLFFEDFGDQQLISAVQEGRKQEFAFDGAEPRDAHAEAAFLDSKLHWERLDSDEGQSIFNFYQALITLKRSGKLGPHDRSKVEIASDEATGVICLRTEESLTLLNLSDRHQQALPSGAWALCLSSDEPGTAGELPPYSAHVYLRVAE
jgi:maltooligosyltrehalose trehalohydrolase